MTVASGYETMPKSYDNEGFLITPTAACGDPASPASSVADISITSTSTQITSTLVTSITIATTMGTDTADQAQVTPGIVKAETSKNTGAEPKACWGAIYLSMAMGILFW